MTTEKHPLLVTFDLEQGFEFMRFCFSSKSLEVKKALENCIQKIKEDAGMSFVGSLKVAIEHPLVDTGDYLQGVLSGLALAVSISRPQEDISVAKFLEANLKKPDNVADISEAFRKRTPC